MTNGIFVLAGTAASIGCVHTVLGPDHYLPFIAMSKARGWSGTRTAVITALCGLGHVLSSVLLGFLGIAVGIAVFNIESLEAVRGDLAGWLLIAFGLVYCLWGIRHAVHRRCHDPLHADGNETAHSHRHTGLRSDLLTPWILFTIFVLGPCEPLIPLIMYPAAKLSMTAVIAVAVVFGLTTIATMLVCVMASYYSLSGLTFPRAEKYAHALAGLCILLCGGAIKFLGL